MWILAKIFYCHSNACFVVVIARCYCRGKRMVDRRLAHSDDCVGLQVPFDIVIAHVYAAERNLHRKTRSIKMTVQHNLRIEIS